MVKYMGAEFYKLLHRKYTYGFFLFMMGGASLLLAIWQFADGDVIRADFGSCASMVVLLLTVGLYMDVLIVDLVFSDQYKCNTLKNEVSFGLPRTRIYLGKLAVEAILGVAVSLIVIVYYVGMCRLLLPLGDPENAAETFRMVVYSTLCAVPQWLGILAVCHCTFSVIRSNTAAAIAAVAVVMAPKSVFQILGAVVHPAFIKAVEYLPGEIVSAGYLHTGDMTFLGMSWAIGALWAAVFTAAGVALFRGKEIN